MKVEIDQSGRIEQLDTNSVVAYANGQSKALFVAAGTKRSLIQSLRRSLISRRDLPAIIFAICIFILLQGETNPLTVEIDEEYSGKEKIIKKTLDKLLGISRRKAKVTVKFKRIGKLSPAHKLAWKVHKHKGAKYLKLTLTELLRYFPK